MHISPRHRRASASPALLAILAPLVMLLAFRAGPTWNGIRLGATEQDIVATLGEPERRADWEMIAQLSYADMDVWLRDGQAYSIVIRGNPATLKNHACLALGLPIGDDDDATVWAVGNMSARLWRDSLSVYCD